MQGACKKKNQKKKQSAEEQLPYPELQGVQWGQLVLEDLVGLAEQ